MFWRMNLLPVLIAVIVLGPLACTQDAAAPSGEQHVEARTVPTVSDRLPYAFDAPDDAFTLPGRLSEISGLTTLPDGRLIAVQDEVGKLFIIDPSSGEVAGEVEFGGNGDYEGVEHVEDNIWVLRSDGDLFEVRDWATGKPSVMKHPTSLSSRFDTEGLAYDASNQRLLIACKEYQGKNLKGRKALYAFDLSTHMLNSLPVLLIEAKLLGDRFKPSALAVHPLSGRYYLLSSVNKAIAVVEPDGREVQVFSLRGNRFPQPEALAFLPNGDLFVGSEGSGGKGTLQRFNYREGS